MRDCIDVKREIGLPVVPETRQAILESEDEIASLKLELLRSPHPHQLILPGMDGLVANEGSQRDDVAS